MSMLQGTRRFSLRAAVVFAAVALSLAACTEGPAPDNHTPTPSVAAPSEVDLGTPLEAMVAGRAGFSRTDDGRPVVAFVAGGQPAQFSLLDSLTGELMFSAALYPEGDTMSMASAFAASPVTGDIYFGDSKGTVYRVDPDNPHLEVLAEQPEGKPNFQVAAATPAGDILFTSYPDASMRRYSPSTGTWRNYGGPGEDSRYLRGLDTDGNFAYAGSATEDPHIIRYNLATGERSRLDPPRIPGSGFVQEVVLSGNYLYARHDESERVHVYDFRTERWSLGPEGTRRGLAAPAADSVNYRDGKLYWLNEEGQLELYDPASGGSIRWGDWQDVGSFRGSGYQDLPGGGHGLVTISTGGRLLGVDEATGQTTSIMLQPRPAPSLIRAMGTTADGRILISAYGTAPRADVYDPRTGSHQPIKVRGQIEGFGSDEHGTLFGMYPSGNIGFIPATGEEQGEPRIIGALGHGQQRPMAILPLGGGRYAVASFPEFGKLGGALSIVDTTSGDISVYPDISKDQTPLSLARVGDSLYIGLGTGGGLGSTRTTDEAGIAVFDLATRKVTDRFIPVPGVQNVAALAPGANGTLWGSTASAVFRIRTSDNSVIRQKVFDDYPDTKSYVRGRTLSIRDGTLWANMRGGLFSIDPGTLERTLEVKGANAVLGNDGNFYLSEGAHLKQFVPGKD